MEIRCIMDYFDQQKEIKKIMQKYWGVLKMDGDIKHIIPTYPKITYRKRACLRDILVSSFLQPLKKKKSWLQKQNGFFKCNKCKACENGMNVKKFKLRNGQDKLIQEHITCEIDFVVYVLHCDCGKQYVGSTVNKVKLRILQHLRAIKNKDFAYAISKHIWEEHEGRIEKMKYFGAIWIDKPQRGGDRKNLLRRAESRLIMDLGTEIPWGLNNDAELHVHL